MIAHAPSDARAPGTRAKRTPPHPPAPHSSIDVGAHRETLEQTLPGRLVLWAHDRPDAVALRVKELGRWEEITWRTYLERVSAVALALRELGVRPRDHVSIHSENCPEWLYVDLAVQGMGACSVGIYQTSPPSDVAYLLNHCGSILHFAEDQEQVDKAVAIAEETPTVGRFIAFDPRGTHRIEDTRLGTWHELLARGLELLNDEPDWFIERVLEMDPDSPCIVIYTSGTTGTPKGAILSSRNAMATQSLARQLGYSTDDLILSYLPLCHVAEKIFSLFAPMQAGCIVHFGESIDTVRQDLREVSPTIFLGVPRIWEKIHAHVTLRMKDASWLKRRVFSICVAAGGRIAPRREAGTMTLADRVQWFLCDLVLFRALQEQLGMRRCRFAISAAAPIAPEILLWFHAIGIPVREAYGQTECSGVATANLPGRNRIGSVGEVVAGLEARIAEDGEVLLRGGTVFQGYLHNAEATAATIDADGWLHTGDLGTIDEAGYLWITGRKKELIITSAGKNISPEKVENALKTSPYIHEVVAVGDGRSYLTALIQIEFDVVADWANRQNIQYTSFTDLSANALVLKMLDGEVMRCNELLARAEQVRRFRTLPRELNEDDGELTATRKVRRRNVLQAYAPLIAELYG
jgi:long-chain acyl-CoA synthetase